MDPGHHHGSLRNSLLRDLFILMAAISLSPAPAWAGSPAQSMTETRKNPLRILHVMSYHSPWKWTDDQFNGFLTAMGALKIEYRTFQMDTKQNPSREAIHAAGKEARSLIDSWQPDLVYATDDNAMEHVVKHYVNTPIPFVFSGVNLPPEKYGFSGSTNVTGVLEQEHFVQTMALLRQLVPEAKRIAVIFEPGPTWEGVRKRMEDNLHMVPEISITSWDTITTYARFKSRVKALQHEADAIALLGIFTFADINGNAVPYADVLRWTAENSTLPDFSFWKDRIPLGTLCAVTVSGFEQGYAAGRLARQILMEGRSPGSLPMRPSAKGEPVISLARARKLGIRVRAKLLLTADVITAFEWEP